MKVQMKVQTYQEINAFCWAFKYPAPGLMSLNT